VQLAGLAVPPLGEVDQVALELPIKAIRVVIPQQMTEALPVVAVLVVLVLILLLALTEQMVVLGLHHLLPAHQ
jgi:ABC-type uncharacterized transport system permease subunit